MINQRLNVEFGNGHKKIAFLISSTITPIAETFEAECVERSQKNSGGSPIPKKIEFKELIFTIKSTNKFQKFEPSDASKILLKFEVTKKNFNFRTAVIKNPKFVELEKEVDKYKNKLAENSKILTANDWLIEEANLQASRIDEYVYWKRSLYTGNVSDCSLSYSL